MWLKKTVAAVIPLSVNQSSVFRVIQELEATSYVDEIIVVYNRVDKKTLALVKKTRADLIKVRNNGFGRLVKKGIRSTNADLVILIEADGAYKGEDVSKLLSYSEEFEMVLGTRTHVSLIDRGSSMTFLRRLVDDLFGKMISWLFLSSNLTDVGCSLRLTSREGYKNIEKELTSTSELILAQWQILAAKKKIRFIEIPVNFQAIENFSKKDKQPYLSFRALKILGLIILNYVTFLGEVLNREL